MTVDTTNQKCYYTTTGGLGVASFTEMAYERIGSLDYENKLMKTIEALASIEDHEFAIQDSVVLPDLDYEIEYMKTIEAIGSHCKSLDDCDHMRFYDTGTWNEYSGLGKHHYIMWRLLKLFSLYMKKHKLHWHVIGGTLLGFLRHGKSVPHTDDLDIAMQYKDRSHLENKGIYEFPKDIVIDSSGGVMWKLSDLNSCINRLFCTRY